MTTPTAAARALRAIPSEARTEQSRANGAQGGRPRTPGPTTRDLRAALARSARLRRSHAASVTQRLRAAVAALDALLALPLHRRDQAAAAAAIGEHHRALDEARATAP